MTRRKQKCHTSQARGLLRTSGRYGSKCRNVGTKDCIKDVEGLQGFLGYGTRLVAG